MLFLDILFKYLVSLSGSYQHLSKRDVSLVDSKFSNSIAMPLPRFPYVFHRGNEFDFCENDTRNTSLNLLYNNFTYSSFVFSGFNLDNKLDTKAIPSCNSVGSFMNSQCVAHKHTEESSLIIPLTNVSMVV